MNFVTSLWRAQTIDVSGHLTKRSADKFSTRKKAVLSSGHSVFKTAALSIQWWFISENVTQFKRYHCVLPDDLTHHLSGLYKEKLQNSLRLTIHTFFYQQDTASYVQYKPLTQSCLLLTSKIK